MFKTLFRLLNTMSDRSDRSMDIPAADLEDFFTGQTYPPKAIRDQLAAQTDHETAFAVACGCCLTGLLGALHDFRDAFPASRSEKMVVTTVEGWAAMYRDETGTTLSVEQLRKRILDAWTKISKAAFEGKTRGEKGTSEKSASMACSLIGLFNDQTISIFRDLIYQKYRTAYGFFNTLKDKKVFS